MMKPTYKSLTPLSHSHPLRGSMREMIMVVFLFVYTMVLAQPGDVEQAFRQRLAAASGKNSTIECNFIQTKRVKNIKQEINSSGRFFYDNAGKMALIYNEPKGDKILMDNDHFIITTAGKKLVCDASSNPMMTQISFMMQACMSGEVSKLGKGWGMEINETTDLYEIKLTPTNRRIQKYISAMLMSFDKSDLTLILLRMNEASGGFTQYRFMDKKLNQGVEPSIFNAD